MRNRTLRARDRAREYRASGSADRCGRWNHRVVIHPEPCRLYQNTGSLFWIQQRPPRQPIPRRCDNRLTTTENERTLLFLSRCGGCRYALSLSLMLSLSRSSSLSLFLLERLRLRSRLFPRKRNPRSISARCVAPLPTISRAPLPLFHCSSMNPSLPAFVAFSAFFRTDSRSSPIARLSRQCFLSSSFCRSIVYSNHCFIFTPICLENIKLEYPQRYSLIQVLADIKM
jgi:hypothetical protein